MVSVETSKEWHRKNRDMATVPGYYDSVRRDVLPAIPTDAQRMLEIGCGAGSTLGFLKDQGLCDWAGGVEFIPEIAEQAQTRLDQVWIGDIERMDLDIPERSLDVILCLDVLEHLVDPWSVVRRLDVLLKPGGCIVASIPNVRNSKVVFPLFWRGEWTYQDYGVLDRTHLRFFVRRTAIELMECSGLQVDFIDYLYQKMKRRRRRKILSFLTFGLWREFAAVQFLIRAVK